jgi:hypothetical protein
LRNLAFVLPFFFALGSIGVHAQTPQFLWQGQVDGTAILHIHGKTLTVQIKEGGPVEQQQFHFSDQLPDTRQNVRVETLQGRGSVRVIDQPNTDNQYTLTVQIEDLQPGSSFYSIALYWDASDNAFVRGAPRVDTVTWSGRVDHAVVVSCQAKGCRSSAESGAVPVVNEHFRFSKPLPARETEVRLEGMEGRGEIRLIDQPRERNQYTAKVSIRDLGPGAADYTFTLVWNRATGKNKDTPILEPSGRGMLWTGTVDGRVQVVVHGGASFSEVLDGARVAGEHAEIFRPLPSRSGLKPTIRKVRGRGEVNIVETPSEQNSYRLIIEIDDPQPGADDYEIEIDW